MSYVFLTKDTRENIIPQSITFTNTNELDVLTGHTLSDTEIREYSKNEYICLSEGIDVPGVGVLRDGDKVKLNLFDRTFYTLHYGWYTTNDGLDMFGWYLVNNERVQPFFKRYIDTVEITCFMGNCKETN